MGCIVTESFTPTERTPVIREPHRGIYEREAIYKILDEGMVCHVTDPIVFLHPRFFLVNTTYIRLSQSLRK